MGPSRRRGIVLALVFGVVGVGAALLLAPRATPGAPGATTSAAVGAQASYEKALLAQRQGHYHDAREGYLRALALDPTLVDARYNLVILTHAVGANDEARHHLEQLAALAPSDPRLPGLRALLAGGAVP